MTNTTSTTMSAPDDARFFMSAVLSALTSNCQCETCRILRKYAEKLKNDMLKVIE